ncbi:MAG: N-acetyltransferase family protein [Alphaproteobacteria bacterium]
MSVVTRVPTADDRAAVASLLADMLAHYRQDAPAERLEAATARLTAGAAGGPFALIALVDGAPCGIAIFSETFPARALTPALFLRDVYVGAAARGHGVGRALMAALARFAKEGGYTRIEWLTGRENAPAQRLYGSIGAPVAESVYYRVEGAAIERMASA